MKIATIIVDDEPLARERIRTLLGTEKEFILKAECQNGSEALHFILNEPIDLVLLDIQMPELDGIRLVEKIPVEKMPFIVFTTAFDAFAVKAFELNAIDYLLKPFTKKRFLDTLERIKKNFQSDDRDLYLSQMLTTIQSVVDKKVYSEKIVIKSDGKIRFVPAREILWVESDANYLKVHTTSGTWMIRETMANFSMKLDPAVFLRLHRSVLANTKFINELKPWFNDDYIAILQNGTQLPIGRTYRKSVNQFFKL